MHKIKGELGVLSFHLGMQQQLWVSPMWEINPHSCYPVNFSYFVILAKLSKRSFPDVWETGWAASTALLLAPEIEAGYESAGLQQAVMQRKNRS